MSHSANYTDTGPTTAFYQGKEAGIREEQERILRIIERYKYKRGFHFENLESMIRDLDWMRDPK